MTTQVKTALALKEWSAVIDAMARGLQLVALRKGGIREKAFLLEGRTFYLQPTFEHQAPELVKPEERERLPRAIADQRDEQRLIVRLRADVVDVWQIDDLERLIALSPYHIFTNDFAISRFNWRPTQPLTVMLMRARHLVRPWQTGLPAGYGGCRSWLELDADQAPADADAVLSDAEFASREAEIRAIMAG